MEKDSCGNIRIRYLHLVSESLCEEATCSTHVDVTSLCRILVGKPQCKIALLS
jgi:hypothetical protein